ncbi:hypothetical protein [Ensifer aridi]|uniref:hypothetical protein n=1 Tax=Ensifer aridi TaxID=1708715 RepID=UPI000A11A887|nr:hypothetical protein [Ensifer aridi]
MTEERYFPVWDRVPDDEFVAAWREHTMATGYPELFDRVSTGRPQNLADVRLLSTEIKVPTLKRDGQDWVPCPLCRPSSPKFQTGRLALFPHEKTVQFIGHNCAAKHIGEDYRVAEQRFRRERRARNYQKVWRDLQARVPALTELLQRLSPMVQAIDASKLALAKEADGFPTFLQSELAHTGGKVSTLVDTGLMDNRGRRIAERAALGTVVGLRFLDKARLTPKLREAQRILGEIQADLPVWSAASDTDALEDLLRIGHRGTSVVNMIRDLLDAVSNSRMFLHENNLALMERWAAADDSPFDHLSFRRKASWILLDSVSYAGRHRASFRISDAMFAELPFSGSALAKIDLNSIE